MKVEGIRKKIDAVVNTSKWNEHNFEQDLLDDFLLFLYEKKAKSRIKANLVKRMTNFEDRIYTPVSLVLSKNQQC